MYDMTSHGGPTAETPATILPLSFPFAWRPGKKPTLSGSTKCLLFGTLPLSQRQMQLLFWAPIKPHHVCHEMLYHTCLCPHSAANNESSKARHCHRAPPVNSEPSMRSADSTSAALPPWCASHHGPDPQHLIQRSGLGIQEWTFLSSSRCYYCCLGTYLEANN